MKKIVVCGLFFLLLIVSISYNTVIKVEDIIKPYSVEKLPDEIKTYIFFSIHSSKELNVDGYESKKEIIDLLSSIKVKKVLISPQAYSPKLKETYHIFLYNYENEIKTLYVNILDKKYIRVNDITYKMLNNPDLSSIYNSIIMAQPKGLIDKFYYDLIEDN
ncbi:hypothetical protein [Sedimentibacter sp.]|uniref:hypothetical protein n=1 Tax=Sedimentibacter sp. TaxID=1960295 RepID=UPI000EE77705|nr:hypothetical protein [Sedimentibacter sp.]HCX62243.1 hypothetical protein [Clostridiales bacterium]